MVVADRRRVNDNIKERATQTLQKPRFYYRGWYELEISPISRRGIGFTYWHRLHYMKPNSKLKYVNAGSNHPESVIEHVPRGIECRLSRNMCPLNGACKTEGVVYKAVVEDEKYQNKIYCECTECNLKER